MMENQNPRLRQWTIQWKSRKHGQTGIKKTCFPTSPHKRQVCIQEKMHQADNTTINESTLYHKAIGQHICAQRETSININVAFVQRN